MRISYVLTTRNKLPYLRILLPELINSRKPGDEIIVADSASTDGTKEFLQEMFHTGKIQKFISEPDCGESHGDNKGILLAEGDFIKIITDDDLFSFSVIRECADFMMRNPSIDILIANGGKTKLMYKPISHFSYEKDFQEWMKKGTAFASCGLGLLFRRSSLPLLGLLDTSYARTDAEYVLRISSNKKIQMALYTGLAYLHVANENSNTNTMELRIREETKRLNKIYGDEKPILRLKKFYVSFFRKIRKKQNQLQKPDFSSLNESYAYYEEWIKNSRKENPGRFLSKKRCP